MPSMFTIFRARVGRSRCETKGATSMPATPTADHPPFVAEEPEHCHDWYRLVQPGQR
jgi:hypothetical protein